MAKPQDFKNTKYYVANNTEAAKLQQAMFKLGFMWAYKAPGAKREVQNWFGRGGWIYVDGDCRMYHGSEQSAVNGVPVKAALQSALFAAAEEHMQAKKAERKASRKRKSLVRAGFTLHTPVYKGVSPVEGEETEVEVVLRNGEVIVWKNQLFTWSTLQSFFEREIIAYRVVQSHDGWITWNGGLPPVEDGTIIDVRFRKQHWGRKEVLSAETGVYGTGTSAPFWRHEDAANDIVAYRICPTIKVSSLSAIGSSGTLSVSGTIDGAGEFSVGSTGDIALDPAANPKHAIGSTSLPMTMPSPLFRAMIALAKQNGALKYGLTNYIGTPVVMSTYLHAIQRHFDAIMMGEEVDPVDGVPHWGAIGANLDIIVSARAAGTLIDDRPRQDGQLEAYRALTPKVAELSELHKDRNPKHYYMKDAQ